MKLRTCFLILFVCTLITAPTPAPAADVTIPNTFQSGTPAVAAEVNANFTAVETAVDDNDSRIAALEAALDYLRDAVSMQKAIISNLQDKVTSHDATISTLQDTVTSQTSTISTLQSDLDDVQSSPVMALNRYLRVYESGVGETRGPLVQLAEVNLQIVNGEGSTDSINGLGNLIIGYNEANTEDGEDYRHCSDGQYFSVDGCDSTDLSWSHSHKSGSHYLVTGSQNSYSQYGGIVAGFRNFTTRAYSTVTGGYGNAARGVYSSVSGGRFNEASGYYSSVSGGRSNEASSTGSSVSGGDGNTASGYYSSVSGGKNNLAANNTSSVSGGEDNEASGPSSSVSGGNKRNATDTFDWAGGSFYQDI